MPEALIVKTERTQLRDRPAVKTVVLGLLALSLISAALLAFGVLSEDVAYHFAQLIYVVVPLGSGFVILGATRTLDGTNKFAWLSIGGGVLAWGLGEAIWVYYEYILKIEVPYPGWADVFYLLGYPLIFVGILLLPHLKPGRLEQLRLSLDAIAGSIALAAAMWGAYLSDQIYLDPSAGFFEQFTNIMYPLGDVVLLIAVMILAVRRSSLRFDARLLALSIGMLATAIADVVYIFQVEADTYSTGGWLDSLWLIGYAGFIAAGWYLMQPTKTTELADRSTRLWQLAAPYAAILALFTLTLLDTAGDASILQMASGIVGLLIIARQAVSIRENRELVEKQRDDLIASISHELRTPLTSVQGFAQLLKERGETLDSEQRVELIEIIESQSRHLGGLVTDLVDVARDRLASVNLSVETLELSELLTDAKHIALNSGEIDISILAEPDVFISGDRRRIIQILVNLFTNAGRYGQGRIEVVVGVKNGFAKIEVHDNGTGVPKRYEESIWERFERGAHRLDSTIPGSGIGLPIARSLVEAHNGTIGYRASERIGGACFTVSLPLLASPVESPVYEAVPSSGVSSRPDQPVLTP